MQGSVMNEHLRAVPKQALEAHVMEKLKEFALVFAQELLPGINQEQLNLAFSRTLYAMRAREATGGAMHLLLRFNHTCRFLGCEAADCALCRNNPHKTCAAGAAFDEAYADNQVLKARCEAEVYVELVDEATGEPFSAPGVEVQLSVVDGDAYNESAPNPLATIEELHVSDEGLPLVQCFGTNRSTQPGVIVIGLQNGRARLPEVYVKDKNDTFHFNRGSTTGHFRLMALAMRRDELGQPVPVEGLLPAVSNKFVVKTQRALNDYRKSAYPHHRDELTRLRYIGAITAARLKDARAWLGRDCPLECVDSVQRFKQLMEYVEANRPMEQKLLELLNMRGKHKHKWDFLRGVLADKIVYDDSTFRAWYPPNGNGCGLLFAAKQAQVNLDKPAGVAQRVVGPDGVAVVQVTALADMAHHPQLQEWRRQAEAAWKEPGHPGWQIVQEETKWVQNWVPAMLPALAAPARTASNSPLAGSPAPQSPVGSGGEALGSGFLQSELTLAQPTDEIFRRLGAPGAHGLYSGFGAAAAAQQAEQPPQLRARSDPAMLRSHAVDAMAHRTMSDTRALQQQQAQRPAELAAMLRVHSEALALLQERAAAAAAAASGGSPPHAAMGVHGLVQQHQHQHQQQMQQRDALLALQQALQQRHEAEAAEDEQLTDSPTAGSLPPAAMETEGSAFMRQHMHDAVQQALQRDVLLRGARTPSDRSAGAPGDAEPRGKRGRGGDVSVVAHPDTHEVLLTTASHGRHMPTARVSGDTAHANMVPLDSVPHDILSALQAYSPGADAPDHGGARGGDQGPHGALPGVDEEDILDPADLPLTSTFSSALHLEDHANAAAAGGAGGIARGMRMLRKTDSDSFKRILGSINSPKHSGELGVSVIDALLDSTACAHLAAPRGELDGPGAGAGADAAAAAADQHHHPHHHPHHHQTAAS